MTTIRIGWAGLKRFAREELRQLLTVHSSDRLWQMPLAAALATGLPMLIGAYLDHMDFGLVASLGGLVFVYLPRTSLYHRMVSLMACSFGMTACYTLGLMSQLLPLLMVPALTSMALVCRAASFSSWRPRSAPIRQCRPCRRRCWWGS
jgi:hypothetical protein